MSALNVCIYGCCGSLFFYLVNGANLLPTVEISKTVQWDQHEEQNEGRGLPGNVETSRNDHIQGSELQWQAVCNQGFSRRWILHKVTELFIVLSDSPWAASQPFLYILQFYCWIIQLFDLIHPLKRSRCFFILMALFCISHQSTLWEGGRGGAGTKL